MMAMKKLPREILREITSYLPNECSNREDLLNYSQACRSFWDAATPAIYRDIDLHFEGSYDKEKTGRPQLRLIKSIAENPKLGALVRTFVNDSNPHNGGQDMTQQDETDKTDKNLLIEAAKSMKFLSRASFSSNPLGIQVVTTLPSYPQLCDLTLLGFIPSEQIWMRSPTSLKSLNWTMRKREQDYEPVSLTESRFLLKVIEATCPDLEVLDISLGDYNYQSVRNTSIAASPEVINGYNELVDTTHPKLTRLRHFGLDPRRANGETAQEEIKSFILDIVRRYGHTLKSITIPGGGRRWTRDWLDFVLEVCAMIPDLRELNLTRTSPGSGSKLTPLEAFHELTTSSATAKVERFSTMDIQGHFSREIGHLFKAWKNLKFLQVGDQHSSGGPVGDDGRLQFDDYRPRIFAFIQALPPSLQQLYLEINVERIWCDQDEDFDPVCNMGNEIFRALPHLHTCDLHAWISDCYGAMSTHPKKGVFYRRLPGDDAQQPKKKKIWTSKMNLLYQDADILVEKYVEFVEDKDFEGEDAKEIWLDDLTFQQSRTEETSRERHAAEPYWSWPFCLDSIQTRIEKYEMWRVRR